MSTGPNSCTFIIGLCTKQSEEWVTSGHYVNKDSSEEFLEDESEEEEVENDQNWSSNGGGISLTRAPVVSRGLACLVT